MTEKLLQDFRAGTFGHGFMDDVPDFVGEEAVAPEDLYVGWVVLGSVVGAGRRCS
jgi:hypothetical protein